MLLEAVAATTIGGHEFTGGASTIRPGRSRQQGLRIGGDSVRRDDQQNETLAVEVHDTDGVAAQISVSVQTNRMPAEHRAPRGRLPGVQAVHDAVDAIGSIGQ
ncbi:hypothetical protein FEK35_22940 [Nocardia cyriacigeorgica]|uniref:Uncharacterized protein n=1 Tax=Nocardia cyriacigeorgica TaxID=135487 RepID=A0A5R8P9E6_9NOCA|nr:hypothetical protein FEK35_22940 [Nocardia cyriacigeorgica]